MVDDIKDTSGGITRSPWKRLSGVSSDSALVNEVGACFVTTSNEGKDMRMLWSCAALSLPRSRARMRTMKTVVTCHFKRLTRLSTMTWAVVKVLSTGALWSDCSSSSPPARQKSPPSDRLCGKLQSGNRYDGSEGFSVCRAHQAGRSSRLGSLQADCGGGRRGNWWNTACDSEMIQNTRLGGQGLIPVPH